MQNDLVHDWLFKGIVWHLTSTKPLPEPILTSCQADATKKFQWNVDKTKKNNENVVENVDCKITVNF